MIASVRDCDSTLPCDIDVEKQVAAAQRNIPGNVRGEFFCRGLPCLCSKARAPPMSADTGKASQYLSRVGWGYDRLDEISRKVVKIGAKVIGHARYAVFQMVEVAVPRDLFGRTPEMIDDVRPKQVAQF